jgi:hypothetical protein
MSFVYVSTIGHMHWGHVLGLYDIPNHFPLCLASKTRSTAVIFLYTIGDNTSLRPYDSSRFIFFSHRVHLHEKNIDVSSQRVLNDL